MLQLFGRHAQSQITFDVHLEMAFQLFGEFTLASFAIEHTEEPRQPPA